MCGIRFLITVSRRQLLRVSNTDLNRLISVYVVDTLYLFICKPTRLRHVTQSTINGE